ncbi:cupin domain-containing protein [Sporosarcina limicola]|uniref:Oxalate decarboxylase/phosphoglucose isomerase-like protein (Cupin superfamily) n=1 Tax=Sporosarcina limicola TaxID=34101 RepID=A0A927MI18_9BACL|nr:cupin domain-containing protein [Sporosarcina limicola]MBE1555079.1 oxalate decarboxylase/phosphoglucose isomerase-like protein (cupin superfamily) [Sporosarcina limicola]
MGSYMDYTSPTTQFAFDVNKSPLFRKDNNNFINVLSIQQLNTLQNVSLLDIFLSINNVIEPHYHQNAAELVYCISGAITVSLMNPFTKQIQNYPITPGQVVNVPQGWWHYIVATTDNVHFLGIFDAPTPEVILGSDILKLTPANIMAHTYCLDENQWKKTIAPVKPSTFIGPPKDCNSANENTSYQDPHYINQYADQMHPYTHQYSSNPQHYNDSTFRTLS